MNYLQRKTVGALVALAAVLVSMAASADLTSAQVSSLTAAVSFTQVQAGIVAVGAVIFGLVVVGVGIMYIRRQVR